MNNNKLSEFGQERVRQIAECDANKIDARNSQLRHYISFGLGVLSSCAFLAFVLGFFASLALVALGEITLLFLVQLFGWLVAGFVLSLLSSMIDNPDIKVGD